MALELDEDTQYLQDHGVHYLYDRLIGRMCDKKCEPACPNKADCSADQNSM